MQATELMQRYWANVRARGDTPKPIYALVSTGGAVQPKGYCQFWSINRKEAAKRAEVLGYPTELVVVRPA